MSVQEINLEVHTLERKEEEKKAVTEEDFLKLKEISCQQELFSEMQKDTYQRHTHTHTHARHTHTGNFWRKFYQTYRDKIDHLG